MSARISEESVKSDAGATAIFHNIILPAVKHGLATPASFFIGHKKKLLSKVKKTVEKTMVTKKVLTFAADNSTKPCLKPEYNSTIIWRLSSVVQ